MPSKSLSRSSSADIPDSFWQLYLLCFSLIWIAGAVFAGSLYVMVSDTAWHTDLMPLPPRLGLLFTELLFTTPLAALLAAAVVALAVLERRIAFHPAPRLARGAVITVFLATVLFVYAGSWMTFRSTGQFLDWTGFRFWLEDPIQILKHVAQMEPYTVLVTPAVALLGAILGAFVAVRLPSQVKRSWSGKMQLLAAVALTVCIFGAMLGPSQTQTDLYASMRDDRSGPLSHVWADIRSTYSESSDATPVLPVGSFHLERQPIVSLSHYLAPIDRKATHRWNVVILLVESLRNDQLLSYGGEREVMPTVEEIAREGRVFTNHYTQSSHSDYADLAPLSSHYPLRSHNHHYYPENPSYPRVLIYDVLKGLGYRTAIFSSQNEGWGGMINYLRTEGLDYLLHSETYEGSTYVPRADIGFADFVQGTRRAGKIDDRFTVSEAIEWIAGVGDQPFFIYMNLQNSHIPYELPADFPPRFGTGQVSFQVRFNSYPRDSVAAVKDLYSNSLAYVDSQIGRLVAHLKQSGRWDQTILIVSGDTGQAFFEHGFAAHANALYNEVMKVPLVIRAPELAQGHDPRPAQHIDVPASILDLLGLPPHPSFQGRSLFEPSPDSSRPLFMLAQTSLAHQYAIVRLNYKLIYDARRKKYLLFDLSKDRGETKDLSAELPERADSLAAILHTWRKIQVDYYRDWAEHGRWYPPVLKLAN